MTGSSAPYQLNTSSETLSKATGPISWQYLRALNVLDTATQASLSIEIGDVKLRKASGQVVQASFAETAPDSSPITPGTILVYGGLDISSTPSTSDTIEVTYAVSGTNALQLLTPDSKGMSITVGKPEMSGNAVAIVQRAATAFQQNQATTIARIPISSLPPSIQSASALRVQVSVTGVKESPDIIASVGHIYQGIVGEGLGKALAPEMDAPEVPVGVGLLPNYPNPFNPATTIGYNLPDKGFVSITVINALGQTIATLVSANQEAGYHEVKFDGANLASGVYFYRLQAGSFVQTRKLLLLK